MKLSLYVVDVNYCNYLRKFEACVPYVHNDKAKRPFLGIVLQINGIDFYAPLSSPKPKHVKMKGQLDFIKIKDGEYCGINLNNMIPIHIEQVKPIDTIIHQEDSITDIRYKILLNNQIKWCNHHHSYIMKCAKVFYNLVIHDDLPPHVKKRCCDFKGDIELLHQYLTQLA